MTATVLISILSWDSPRYLANLLDNLDAVSPSYEGRNSHHIHILDQGSGPETVDLIKAFVERGDNRSAGLLRENIGFSAGHNLVFDTFYGRLDFDYFLILNHDLLFGRATWLDRLVEAMEDEGIGIAGPIVWQQTEDGTRLESGARPNPGRDPYFVQASIAMVRTSAVERFGLFDTAFTPAYYEDTDLSRRYVAAGLRLGWAEVQHVHSYLGYHSKLLTQKKQVLDERFGPYRERNRALFEARWLHAVPPRVTPELVAELWPGVYRPPPSRRPKA